MSIAHLLQPAELTALTAAMKDARVAVHAYAVGSKTDMQLLGILATQTGGVVKVDLATATLGGTLVTEVALGGDVGDVAITGTDAGYVTYSTDMFFTTRVKKLTP